MRKTIMTGLLFFVTTTIALLMITTILTTHTNRQLDLIQVIQTLKREGRTDDAHDIVQFLQQLDYGQKDELETLDHQLTHGITDKIKSFYWDGAIKGQVLDSWSGLGAITADLCVFGDFRDLFMQSWKYLTKAQDYDQFVLLLSGIGISLSTVPLMDGVGALAKATGKYIKKIPNIQNHAVIRLLASGKISPNNSRQIWNLFKKTAGQSLEPSHAFPAFPA